MTGMAWTTALGGDVEDVWRRLLAGESGLVEVDAGFPVRNRLVAVATDVDPARPPSWRQVRLTVSTARRALAHAGVGVDPGLGVVLGTSFGDALSAPPALSTDSWAREAMTELGVVRPPVVVSTACSSGSDALALGAALIRAGVVDSCLCGGVDVYAAAKHLGHSALGAMSPTRLRAFDRSHDGMLLGEGAAFMLLEPFGAAVARGAAVHAVLRGSGASNDAAGLTHPDASGDGVLLAVRRSLDDAGATPAEVAVFSTHGSGTPVNDGLEVSVLATLFTAPTDTVALATKGAFGHSLGATGAIEAITTVLALRDRTAPPVPGLVDPVAGFPLLLPRGAPAPVPPGLGVSLTTGFGGFNTSLVFEVGEP